MIAALLGERVRGWELLAGGLAGNGAPPDPSLAPDPGWQWPFMIFVEAPVWRFLFRVAPAIKSNRRAGTRTKFSGESNETEKQFPTTAVMVTPFDRQCCGDACRQTAGTGKGAGGFFVALRHRAGRRARQRPIRRRTR